MDYDQLPTKKTSPVSGSSRNKYSSCDRRKPFGCVYRHRVAGFELDFEGNPVMGSVIRTCRNELLDDPERNSRLEFLQARSLFFVQLDVGSHTTVLLCLDVID